jgi:dihydrofolate reductase
MKISLVAAIAENGAIGKDNKLLWHLSNDLKFFKAYTLGKVIVMGSRRALPGRINVVITNSVEIDVENIVVFNSLDAALSYYTSAEEVCIVGGAQMYAEALPLATHLILTRVSTSPEADVFFPNIDWHNWKLLSEEKHLADEKHAFDYTFQIFERAQ